MSRLLTMERPRGPYIMCTGDHDHQRLLRKTRMQRKTRKRSSFNRRRTGTVLSILTVYSLTSNAFVPLSVRLLPRPTIPTLAEESTFSRPEERSVSFTVSEVDVLYGSQTRLVYDASEERYVPSSHAIHHAHQEDQDEGFLSSIRNSSSWLRRSRTRLGLKLRHSFLPEGVYPSYYRFIRWRILQRFVNANVHVFGTQSLLMGLGIKSRSSLGLSAALNWVLKDALGKIVRMGWASKMGRKFDSDAKRWRFRSSFVFAFGNALEIITYVFPSLFLLWATLANCCKQISMLTSSSTRTAIYNSFRDGKRENIGDITAKGEAQIAVVDLLGIASGVSLSRAVGMSVRNVLSVYVVLQAIELFCLYHEIRAVEFRVLNFERLVQLVTSFVNENGQIPTPQEMAKREMIFLPPQHLQRRAIAFGSLSRAKLAPDELLDLLEIFQKERFLLVVGKDVKNRRRRRRFWLTHPPHIQDQCHIVLHKDATNVDIVKSTLALSLLRQALSQQQEEGDDNNDEDLRTRKVIPMISEAYRKADELFPALLKSMSVAGWAAPARFMFGRVTMRADWPLRANKLPPPPSIQASVNGKSSTVVTTTTTTT